MLLLLSIQTYDKFTHTCVRPDIGNVVTSLTNNSSYLIFKEALRASLKIRLKITTLKVNTIPIHLYM